MEQQETGEIDKKLIDEFMSKSNNESEGEYYTCNEEYLLDCCRGNCVAEVEGLLQEEGPLDLFYLDNNRNTCLHMAAANGHLDII